MKQSSRLGLLKYIAILEISLFVFTASFVLRKVIFGYSGGSLSYLLFFIFVAGGALAGYYLNRDDSKLVCRLAETSLFKFLAFTLEIEEKVRFAAKVVAAVTAILPILAVLIIFRLDSIFHIIFEAVFAVLPYMITVKASTKHYRDIMVNGIVYLGFSALAAALAASCFYYPLSGFKQYIYVVIYLYILIYLVLKNQEDIDANIYSKKYIQKSILPQNMRSFNLAAVLVLFFVVILLFNLKTVVAAILAVIGKFTALAALMVLWVMSMLFPEGGGQGGQAGEELVLPKDDSSQGNPILNLIFIIIFTAIFIYLLYKFLPAVFRRFAALFSRLADFIRRVFNLQKTDNNITGDYDDESETIRPEKGGSPGVFKRRKRGRDSDRSTDTAQRVRYIYGLILKMLDTAGIGRMDSDTVTEIYRKSGRYTHIAGPFLHITRTYEKVRYGDSIPGFEEMYDYENSYNKTVELLKNK